MNFILNFMQYILLIFTGAEFPVSYLPKFGQFISHILPLTRSIEGVNDLITNVNNVDSHFYILILGEMIVGIVYGCLSVILIKYTEKQSRINGNYDFY